MKFLRTAPTSRLLAMIGGLLAATVAGAAIAAAAAGTGPIPKREPLATALHAALKAPAVKGISADISFTNHLIDASSLQGSDPLLSGASGRLWIGDHRFRLELQSSNGDAQIVVNKSRFWISDPGSHTVYEGTVPAGLMGSTAEKTTETGKGKAGHAADHGIPTIATIQRFLTRLMTHVNVSGARPTDVAGQPSYSVRISPKHDGGLLGSAEIAWDAIRGVPLRFAIYARGNPTPVLELTATNISYGSVPVSDFNVAPPVGSKVVQISAAKVSSTARARAARLHGKRIKPESVRGAAAVAAKLPFALVAPKSLVGLPRHSVSLLSWGGKPAALLTYGKGLGGIAVIEQTAPAKSTPAPSTNSGPDGSPLTLPTVSINGASGTELDTALGTLIRFTRSGVAYTVAGSVPSAAADAAARAL